MQYQNHVPGRELRALVREAFAIDNLPDGAVHKWMKRRGLDFKLHARLGTIMALPEKAPVPSWARLDNVPWPEAGLRLLLPACDLRGKLRGVAAVSITGVEPRAAVPASFTQTGLLVACPVARRALHGGEQPARLIITEDFLSWLRWVEFVQRTKQLTAVWGLLAQSWSAELERKIPRGCTVVLAAHDATVKANRLRAVYQQLQPRAVNGDVELHHWPSTLRFA